MPRNLSPAVTSAIAAPQKTMALFLELNFENAVTTGALSTFPIVGVQVIAGVLYVGVSTALTAAEEAQLYAGQVSFEGVTVATWLNNASLNGNSAGFTNGPGTGTTISFLAPAIAGMPETYPYTLDTGTVVEGTVVNTGVYDMLNWILMSPALAAANHFASTELDGITPANHLYTQLGAGNFYWIKGDSGYPWDINIFDNNLIYLSTTELTYASASEGKRFESLTPAIGLKGVPFCKRQMKIGDVVLGSDSRFGIYTACGVATYENLGNTKCTLVGGAVQTLGGTGINITPFQICISIQYEWSLDSNYNHQTGSTMETYTFCQPYGLVRWMTQLWNMSTGAYDPPTNATNYNILTPGVSGIPFSDPCGFGTNGGGTLNPGNPGSMTEAPLSTASGGGSLQTSGTTLSLALWSGIGLTSSLGPAWDPGATFPYGQVFIGMGWMGRIESVPQNSELTAENMTLMLSGIPLSLLGDVVNTVRLSGTAALWLGFFSNGVLLPDPLALWDGALDVPTVSDGAETCSVMITVENALLALNLSSNRRFTTLDQQLDYPGDTGFDYVSAMQDLYLPFPDGTINQGGNITSFGAAPSSPNALTVTPSGAQQLALGGVALQVSASAVFVTGPFSVAGGGPGSEVVTSVGLWTSSDPMVATVTSGTGANLNSGGGNFGTGGGLITAVGLGNCTITFVFGQFSCSLTVTVLP